MKGTYLAHTLLQQVTPYPEVTQFKIVSLSACMRTGATELRALFDLLGQPVSYQKLFNIMEQYDVDESGQLDFGEFLKMYWWAPPVRSNMIWSKL